ncbi:MAG TPA: hypothetical protein VER55_11750 [Ardenticatenaceae bacterium]|nr:hypothetical protein [Ardenticatenaceae bacterium]
MPESIEEVKRRLRHAYLGKAGIHGLGISGAEKTIRVHVDPEVLPGQEQLLAQLLESARPFPVKMIREKMAHLAGGTSAPTPSPDTD